MIGSFKASATRPARISLTQFSEDLLSRDSQDRPSLTTPAFSLADIHQRRFAADVVAAMSSPALEANKEAENSPVRSGNDRL
jgi:hypothetical protein